ncbi:MAG: glycine oxidase ThiO [Acidimicrobiia bacterium]|nr:MAG: glycine oxidase ThiO [Acidimicrobiia bacterium]
MTRVVVVGGGVIGLAVGWRCAQQGWQTAVVDPHPGRGASWAAAGMLAPVSEATFGEDRLLALNLESARMYPDFVAELERTTGMEVGYRRCGTLMVARTFDDVAALERLHRFQLDLGLEATWLESREVKHLEPALHPSVRAGVLVPGDHQVDNRRLVEALAVACRKEGVEGIEGEVAEVEPGRGVRLADGRQVPADWVVVAAGWRSADLPGLGFRPPVRPVKGQLLHLRDDPRFPLTERTVRGFVEGRSFYLVSRGDGRYVLGATVEEKGEDLSPTAGAVYELLRDCIEVLPGAEELQLAEVVVGLRPGTPDNGPILGQVGPGLVLATGHYRNGILLAPITAEAVRCVIAGVPVPSEVEGFGPERFEEVG